MLDDPHNGEENEVYFYHSDLCASRAQSQACLSYAETKQSVQSAYSGINVPLVAVSNVPAVAE